MRHFYLDNSVGAGTPADPAMPAGVPDGTSYYAARGTDGRFVLSVEGALPEADGLNRLSTKEAFELACSERGIVPGGGVVWQDPVITRLEFALLFTMQERIEIRASADPVVADFQHLLDLAEDVNLVDPNVIAGLGYYESVGLLDAGRKEQVLAGEPPT